MEEAVKSVPAVEEVEKPEEEEKAPTLLDLIIQAGGPGPAEIERLKLKHGDVYVSAFDNDEVFIFRAVRRLEYRQIQLDMANPELKLDQFDYEERLCKTCVLWPDLGKSPALLEKAG